ncbi:MAG: phosphonate C-P lyase system protein PhnH [Oculatellaceae cyanobacterium Prado106]|jgi:alpha-D-ribose 1-methylphosphonate 5-triphosphate synthase subunit PhnH|nr:phosphonate C-P lyase system protein PhnH [Oculatellaceae cyanobacterium Prado106]
MITQLAGFPDPVHDAQVTFRSLLNALAHPGQVFPISPALEPPPGMTVACAAACLTLMDMDTQVWVQTGGDRAVLDWLRFHTGCRITTQPQGADFALVWDGMQVPDLAGFRWGTDEYPEQSTTLLVQVAGWDQGVEVQLRGAGILEKRAIAPPLSSQFWHHWQQMTPQYPLGVDVFLLAQTTVMGLPRTSVAEVLEMAQGAHI